jgi:hypothetical protein
MNLFLVRVLEVLRCSPGKRLVSAVLLHALYAPCKLHDLLWRLLVPMRLGVRLRLGKDMQDSGIGECDEHALEGRAADGRNGNKNLMRCR